MKRIFKTVFSLVLTLHLVLLQSCATICQPGPDMIPVNSDPAGAVVYLDGQIVGRTPCTVSVDRASDCYIEIIKEGYHPVIVDQDKKLAGWFFPGNLLWLLLWPGLPIAVIVDLASSNQGKYSTTPINVHLAESSETRPAGNESLSPNGNAEPGAQEISEKTGGLDSSSAQSPTGNDLERLKAEHEILRLKLEMQKMEQELITSDIQPTPPPIESAPSCSEPAAPSLTPIPPD